MILTHIVEEKIVCEMAYRKGKELYLSVYCRSSAGALIGDTVN